MEGKKEFYENRIKKCSDEISELNKKANVLSAVRLLIAVLFLAGLYISYKKNSNVMAVAVIITSLAVFTNPSLPIALMPENIGEYIEILESGRYQLSLKISMKITGGAGVGL